MMTTTINAAVKSKEARELTANEMDAVSGGSRIYRITNIRANASGLSGGSAGVTQVIAS
jgi:hypothetical protein